MSGISNSMYSVIFKKKIPDTSVTSMQKIRLILEQNEKNCPHYLKLYLVPHLDRSCLGGGWGRTNSYALDGKTSTFWCIFTNTNDIHNYVNVTFNKIRTKFYLLKMNYSILKMSESVSFV